MASTKIQERRRQLLQTTFLKKKERNPRFTIRAFAAQLNMNSGSLSRLLSGNQPITENTFEKLKPSILAECSLDEFESRQLPKMEVDKFQILSNWYHLAILELTHLSGFQSEVNWIASMLGISVVEAKDAVDRLFALGFLDFDEKGRWFDTEAELSTLGTIPSSQILRRYQQEILDLAKNSLDFCPPEERDCTGLTLSLNSKELDQIRKILTKARREMIELSSNSENKDRVYQLSLAFFPLTKMQPKKKKSTPREINQ